MKRQQRQMLILAVVLCALCAVFFGLRQYNEIQAEKAAAEQEEGILVLDVEDAVTGLSYDYSGQTYSFVQENGTWYAAEDKGLSIKQYLVKSMVNALSPLSATQVIENVTDLEQYGLESPERIIFAETAEESFELHVGMKNTVTDSCYVCLPDTDTVYVVDASYISRFDYTLDYLIEETVESETTADSESTAADEAESD